MAPKAASCMIICAPFLNTFKVLLLERSNFGFYGGLTVFPGGALDVVDSNPDWNCYLPKDQPIDLNTRICAIRESFEESGLMFCIPLKVVKDRTKMNFLTYCKSKLIVPNTLDMNPFANWVSPISHPKRFATIFYVTTIPEIVQVFPDKYESVSAMWETPEQAIKMFREGKISFLPPQFCILEELITMSFEQLKEPRLVPTICPELEVIGEGRQKLKLSRDPFLNYRREQSSLELIIDVKAGKKVSIDWANKSMGPKL